MGSFIVLGDGRAWAVRDAIFDIALELIVEELPKTLAGNEFADWLLEQRVLDRGMGLGHIDLRELTYHNRRAFKLAAQRVYSKAMVHPEGANDIWLEYYSVLLKLIKSVNRHEDPNSCNPHIDVLVPPTRKRSGPGWK